MMKYEARKTIRLTPEQEANWNPDHVRQFLESSDSPSDESDNLFKIVCRQLITLFDQISKIEYPNYIKGKLSDAINRTVDVKLIDEVKKKLANG